MRKFGLIGYPLSHSFSQKYFSDKFDRERIADCSYRQFALPSLDQLKDLLAAEKQLCGLNVTIPYKQQVIPYLQSSNEIVQKTGACNCIRIAGGRLMGYNTDTIGFEQSLKTKLQPIHRKALVLGSGGASRAVEYVLQKLSMDYVLVSRNPPGGRAAISYEQVDEKLLSDHQLIINTTPLGMFPDLLECPPLPYRFLTAAHFLFDLIYNPAVTLFLQKGKERGALTMNGLEMLQIQAEESWKIWND